MGSGEPPPLASRGPDRSLPRAVGASVYLASDAAGAMSGAIVNLGCRTVMG